jgi:hypothetical protein
LPKCCATSGEEENDHPEDECGEEMTPGEQIEPVEAGWIDPLGEEWPRAVAER